MEGFLKFAHKGTKNISYARKEIVKKSQRKAWRTPKTNNVLPLSLRKHVVLRIFFVAKNLSIKRRLAIASFLRDSLRGSQQVYEARNLL